METQRRRILSKQSQETIDIRYAEIADCEKAQLVLNHKQVIGWLGGMTFLETLKSSAVTAKSGKVGLWLAENEQKEVVGAMLCGGRPAAFRAKYGSVGVLPEHRRKRISTALYFALTLQTITEGRRLWEDSIVGDNPFQFMALPTIGLKKVGELRHRTGSGKGLVLFDFSLMDKGSFEHMEGRAIGGQVKFRFHILSNYYSDECWTANSEAYKKQAPAFFAELTELRQKVLNAKYAEVHRNDVHPTDSRRKSDKQAGLI
jgi:hypothetical protein